MFFCVFFEMPKSIANADAKSTIHHEKFIHTKLIKQVTFFLLLCFLSKYIDQTNK